MTSSRRVRFGWNVDGTPNDEQQKTIDLIATLWVDLHGLATLIAKELNNTGVPTARGGQWRDTSVRKIIADNPERVAAAEAAVEEERRKAPTQPVVLPLPGEDGEPYLMEWDERDWRTGRIRQRGAWIEPIEEAELRRINEEYERWKAAQPPTGPRLSTMADLAAYDRWRLGKTRRIPGPRLPDGSYPRGYWPMPAWYFFEQARLVAKQPCMCRRHL
jgi:hypothetical protein